MQFTWDIDPVILPLWGGFGFRYYGLLFSLVFVIGFFFFRWQVRRAGGSEDDAYDVVLPIALGTIIGARLGHVFFYNAPLAIRDPLWIFQFWKGGLASHGAFIGILIAIWYYAHKHRQSYLEVLDRCTFSVATGAILVRIGNLFNSEIVGRVTGGDWGVRFPRFDMLPPAHCPLRHPSQLYEAFMGLAVMGLLLWADRHYGKEKRPRGVLTGVFIGGYFTGRFLVEFFKEYHVLPTAIPLTMGQFLSIPAAILGYTILRISLQRGQPAHWNVVESKTRPK